MPKKVRWVCIYGDFWDLNNTSPKDDFSLAPIDLLVVSTVGHGLLSFMDGYVDCKEIKMNKEN